MTATRGGDSFASRVRSWPPVRIFVLGVVLIQAAWILALPPFRGLDEFDHSYRAAAVAHGEIVAPPSSATRGTGATLTVPRDIVEAAGPECRRLPYTEDADCVPIGDGEMVKVASGAGRYNPVFYALVGVPGLPFEGTSALYVMRIVSALLCLAFLAAAAATSFRFSSSVGPVLGLGLALTPVVAFSTVVLAPNGLEMAAAVATWCGVLALVRHDPATSPPTPLLAVTATGAAVLLTLRSLGPLWLLLMLLVVVFTSRNGRRQMLNLMLHDRRAQALSAALVLVAAASAFWTISQRSLEIGQQKVPVVDLWDKLLKVVEFAPLWILQSIAAFPTRSNNAPTVVYLAGLTLFFGMIMFARRRAAADHRAAAAFVAGLSLLVPGIVTVATYEKYGVAWQGRYTLPLAFGIVLLLGWGLEATGERLRTDVVIGGLAAFVAAHTVSATALMLKELDKSPGVDNGAWFIVPVPLVTFLMAGGSALVWVACVVIRHHDVAPNLEETSA